MPAKGFIPHRRRRALSLAVSGLTPRARGEAPSVTGSAVPPQGEHSTSSGETFLFSVNGTWGDPLLWGHREGSGLWGPQEPSRLRSLWYSGLFPCWLCSRSVSANHCSQNPNEGSVGRAELPCGNRRGAQSLVSWSLSPSLFSVLWWLVEQDGVKTPVMPTTVQVLSMVQPRLMSKCSSVKVILWVDCGSRYNKLKLISLG